jgi:MFS transporter, DHA1 family, multidrug resistance protein
MIRNGASLTTLPQAFADSYWIFTAQRFAVGLFIGGILPTANALVGRLVPRAERGTVYGITASAMFLGNSIGPLSGADARRRRRSSDGRRPCA